MNNKSIGVFDSGLGGLTVVKELKRILPYENITYFGDTARIPYGSKSRDTIYKYTKDDIRFLLSKDVKAIVVACGTASSAIDDDIIKNTAIPLISVINPASAKAFNVSKNKNIGIIATNATIRSRSYVNEIKKISSKVNIYDKSCPLFVPLVENGYFHKNNEAARLIAKDYLSYFDDKNIDTLILGCTHYPLLYDLISDIMGDKVALVDAGKETAALTKQILEDKGILSTSKSIGKAGYYVSDTPLDFAKEAAVFLDEIIDAVTKIEIGNKWLYGALYYKCENTHKFK